LIGALEANRTIHFTSTIRHSHCSFEQHHLHDLAATVCIHCSLPFAIPLFYSIFQSIK